MIDGLAQAFLKEALTKALKSGGEKFLEELVEMMSEDQLKSLHGILDRVLKRRKQPVIEARGG